MKTPFFAPDFMVSHKLLWLRFLNIISVPFGVRRDIAALGGTECRGRGRGEGFGLIDGGDSVKCPGGCTLRLGESGEFASLVTALHMGVHCNMSKSFTRIMLAAQEPVQSSNFLASLLRRLVPPGLRRTKRNAPPVAPDSAQPQAVAGEMSQWELIRRRFTRHRLAVFALFVLIVFYLIAAFAEFVAPHSTQWRDLDYMFAPPQIPKFSFRHGIHTDALIPAHDPITLQKGYRAADAKVPLGFFVKGEPYRLWGRIPMERRLFSIDTTRLGTRDFVTAAEEHPEGRAPSFYFLGADKYGRDLYSRLIFGARISLSIGMLAVLISVTLGIIIGGISGYVGGLTDDLIQRFMEILRSFPQIPLWIALGALLPADWSQVGIYMGITVVLSLLGWTGLARAVRGKIMALREEEYAVAARLLGAGHGRILFKHLIPGFASHIIVSLSLSVPGMILGETALSFLGLGLRPPVVSWGVMLQDCMHMQTVAHYPWLLMPVVFIVGAVLAFNYVGDGIRDAADPYSTK